MNITISIMKGRIEEGNLRLLDNEVFGTADKGITLLIKAKTFLQKTHWTKGKKEEGVNIFRSILQN